MPNSMTGFARREIQASWGVLSCEVRSVNHRYLEPLIRLPESLRPLEVYTREQCRKKLHRGKVEFSMQLQLHSVSEEGVAINTSMVEQLMGAIKQVSDIGASQQLNLAAADPLRILQWPDVVQQQNVDMEVVEAAGRQLIDEAIADLIAHRQREGVELVAHLEQRLTGMTEIVSQVRTYMPEILSQHQQKMQQRLQELNVELDEDRFAQEVALLINKTDVDEELDRLSTHITEVRHILSQKGSIGRRLDFMMQELNREANTLSSKSIHTDTTQAAVSAKVLIEQMREQIQNVE